MAVRPRFSKNRLSQRKGENTFSAGALGLSNQCRLYCFAPPTPFPATPPPRGANVKVSPSEPPGARSERIFHRRRACANHRRLGKAPRISSHDRSPHHRDGHGPARRAVQGIHGHYRDQLLRLQIPNQALRRQGLHRHTGNPATPIAQGFAHRTCARRMGAAAATPPRIVSNRTGARGPGKRLGNRLAACGLVSVAGRCSCTGASDKRTCATARRITVETGRSGSYATRASTASRISARSRPDCFQSW